ncbi:type VII secretion-associated protein, partial [Amycolatopsis alba DSM 44262]
QIAFSPRNSTRPQGPPSPPMGQQGIAAPAPWRPGEPSRETKPAERGGKSKKTPWIIAAAAVAVAAVVGGVLFAVNSGDAEPEGRTFAQYDYRFIAPMDWTQTDDRVAKRQVVIHPNESLDGDDLVVAQEYVMDYDATADRQKLVDELGTGAGADPAKYSGFNGSANYAGKTVVYYRETKPKARVDWYVVAQGKIRVHIGCQYGTGSPFEQRVSAACEQVVKTMAVVN